MNFLSSYDIYITEDSHIWKYELGDRVLVIGKIDEKNFNNVKGIIIDRTTSGQVSTNIYKNGFCEKYYFTGDLYEVEFKDGDSWWCPVWNIALMDMEVWNKVKPLKKRKRWYERGKFLQESKGRWI